MIEKKVKHNNFGGEVCTLLLTSLDNQPVNVIFK